MEIIWKAWTETGRWSYHGKYYDICSIEVRPKPFQNPLRPYWSCFSVVWNSPQRMTGTSSSPRSRHPWSWALFRERSKCMARNAKKSSDVCRKDQCAHILFTLQTTKSPINTAALRCCVISINASCHHCLPTRGKQHQGLFLDIVERLKSMRTQDLTSRSILVGPAEKIIEELTEIEASGISEVIFCRFMPETSDDGGETDAPVHGRNRPAFRGGQGPRPHSLSLTTR